MQSLTKVSHTARRAATPQRRQAAPRPLLHAPQRLNRSACACGGTCPHCSGAADPLATAEPDSTPRLQRRAAAQHGSATAPPIVHEVLRSSGLPLDAATRAFMEPRFGRDFGEVQVHTDGRAAESARAVNARAYTVGSNVVFGAGQFMPTARAGQRLLAHELAHVTQQSNDRTAVQPASLAISKPHDASEREADQIADAVMGGSAATSPPTDGGKSGGSVMLQRTIGDGHDLQSARFAGDLVLEACFDNERLVRFGSRGPAVEKIQQALVDAGFPLPEFGVDGIFESETQGAVRNYQRAHGLDPDGIVGPITMGNLDALFASPAPPAPAPPRPAPAPPGPPPAPPGPAPAPPGPAPAPPGPAPAPPGPGPAPTPPAPPAPAPPAPAPPAPAPSVPVTITGGSELWHFNGASPAGYPLAERLTASAGGLPGTFNWTVVSGSNFAGFRLPPVPFPLPFAFDPTVNLVSIAPSRAINDVQVRVDFTGVGGGTGTATRQFTVQAPQSLNPTGNVHTSVPRGYSSFISYTIQDQFRTRLPRTVEVNEQWDNKPPIPDFAGTNWPSVPLTEGHLPAPAAAFADHIQMTDGVPPTLVPPPTAPSTPPGAVLVQHFRGHWQVGSATIGGGRRVRSVTWRFFQDHGDHA